MSTATAVTNVPAAPTSALIPQTDMKAIIALDQVVKSARNEIVEADRQENQMVKAMVLARSTAMIRDMLKPMMGDILQLMGSPLGFRTDRDDKPANERYRPDDVVDVVAVALLQGYQLVNNEFNIIARNFYGTKNGFERLVREFPGFRDLKMQAGVPCSVGDKGALVPYRATWTLNGVADGITCDITRSEEGKPLSDTRIPVRVNGGMGTDAILGKAKAKMLRRIYERLTGSQQSCVDDVVDGDLDPAKTIDGDVKPSETIDASSTPSPEPSSEPVQETVDEIEQFVIETEKMFDNFGPDAQKGNVNRLYDVSAGPESAYQLSPEQDQRLAKKRDEALARISANRGANSNKNAKQRTLPGGR